MGSSISCFQMSIQRRLVSDATCLADYLCVHFNPPSHPIPSILSPPRVPQQPPRMMSLKSPPSPKLLHRRLLYRPQPANQQHRPTSLPHFSPAIPVHILRLRHHLPRDPSRRWRLRIRRLQQRTPGQPETRNRYHGRRDRLPAVRHPGLCLIFCTCDLERAGAAESRAGNQVGGGGDRG